MVKPNNHRFDAAEQAIQTCKDAFIVALATTDSEFPLQLWDKLAPQVQNTLNILGASRINPNILAYEALNGLYNWDCYPLAPPGCKAIIYEAPAVQGSWALGGTDAWIWVPPKTITDATYITSPKHAHIAFQGRQSSFNNIAKSQT